MADHLRTLKRLASLARGILAALREGGDLESLSQRAAWQQLQARRILAALEVETIVSGTLPSAGLVVCNHLSYIDVLLIAAQGPVVFVAKADVGRWPVIGGLLKCAGTILAERGRPMTSRRTADEICHALNEGMTVVLFPEGTSSDGVQVLPFKPTLLQAALDTDSVIVPAAIFYHAEGGDVARHVCYWGDATFFPHLVRLAALKKIVATLEIGRALSLPAHRKQAARLLQAEVRRMQTEASLRQKRKL